MGRGKSQFWWRVVLITAAVMLPFGTVIAIAVAAARARRARRAERLYEEWWRHRDLARAASRSNGDARHSHELAVGRGPERQ